MGMLESARLTFHGILSPWVAGILLAAAGVGIVGLYFKERGVWEDAGMWEGRLVAGCESYLPLAVSGGQFSADLYDCLDKVRIELDVRMRGIA